MSPYSSRPGTRIHPAAFVDPDAELGQGVEIGPGVVIGPEVVLGDRVKVGPHAVLTGDLHVGDETRIFAGAVLGEEPQDLGFRGESSRVRIGARCTIREHVTVHRGTGEGTETVVGDQAFLMSGCHVAHNCRVGERAILANGVLLAGHVSVGARAFVSGNCAVHQFCRVGTLAMIGGLSRVLLDVPPFALVVGDCRVRGVNSVGVRRAGIPRDGQEEIRAFYKLLYRSGLDRPEAIRRIASEARSEAGRELAAFLTAPTRRGLAGN